MKNANDAEEKSLLTLETIANALLKEHVKMLPFYKKERHLYIDIDNMAFQKIIDIRTRAGGKGLECNIIAFPSLITINKKQEIIAIPYLHIWVHNK
jgi:hypothetical protein